MNIPQITHFEQGRYVRWEDYHNELGKLSNTIIKLQDELNEYKPNEESMFVIRFQNKSLPQLREDLFVRDYKALIAALQTDGASDNVISVRVFALHEMPVVTQSFTVKLPE